MTKTRIAPTIPLYNHPTADMNPESNCPLKVFLCHTHPDADKVRALYARLKADGLDAWLDKENTCGE
jgi:hypothetical protein